MTDMTLVPKKTTAEAQDYQKAIWKHRVGRVAWWLGVAFVFFARSSRSCRFIG